MREIGPAEIKKEQQKRGLQMLATKLIAGSTGPKVPFKSPSKNPAATKTAICEIKKQTMTRRSIDRMVCHGVDACHTVCDSGGEVSGTMRSGACVGFADWTRITFREVLLSSPITRH